MDNNQTKTQQPITSSNPTAPVTNSVANNTDSVASDVLNTQQVDPFSLPQSQMEKDLELLKKNDTKKDDDESLNNSTTTPKETFVPFVKMKITDIDVLKLQNPFKGQ